MRGVERRHRRGLKKPVPGMVTMMPASECSTVTFGFLNKSRINRVRPPRTVQGKTALTVGRRDSGGQPYLASPGRCRGMATKPRPALSIELCLTFFSDI
jgi:hypothetical protein